MKFFLVFYSDHGNREDCSVYYSYLVQAKTPEEAKQKAAVLMVLELDRLDALEMTLIT